MANTHSLLLTRSSGQYAQASDSASLSVTGDLTIELWVKVGTAPGSGIGCPLVFKGNYNDHNSYQFFYMNEGGTMKLVGNIFSTDGNSNYCGSRVAQTLTPGTWYHVAMVVTVANALATKFEFFVNGSSVGNGTTNTTGTTPTSIVDLSVELGVGHCGDPTFLETTYAFDGRLDDIRIWNTARSQSQISSNMNTELVGNESGLQAYWKLNNAYTDSTSNGNTLSATGSPTFSTDIPAWATDVTVNQGTPPAITATIPSYTVTAVRTVTVSQGTPPNATFTIPTYSQISTVSVSPSVQTATFSIPTYSVTADGAVTVSPSAQVCTFTIPSYTVEAIANTSVAPSVQVCTFTIPAYTPTVISNITISPSPFSMVFSIPTYSVLGDYWEDKFAQPSTSWSNKF